MRLNSRIENNQEKFSEKFYNKFVSLIFPYQRITDVRLGHQKAGHQEVKPASAFTDTYSPSRQRFSSGDASCPRSTSSQSHAAVLPHKHPYLGSSV